MLTKIEKSGEEIGRRLNISKSYQINPYPKMFIDPSPKQLLYIAVACSCFAIFSLIVFLPLLTYDLADLENVLDAKMLEIKVTLLKIDDKESMFRSFILVRIGCSIKRTIVRHRLMQWLRVEYRNS